MRKEEIKWYSETEIIDTDTGEIITKSQKERGNYRTIKREKKYEISEKNGIKHGIIKHKQYVREHEQQRLFD